MKRLSLFAVTFVAVFPVLSFSSPRLPGSDNLTGDTHLSDMNNSAAASVVSEVKTILKLTVTFAFQLGNYLMKRQESNEKLSVNIRIFDNLLVH